MAVAGGGGASHSRQPEDRDEPRDPLPVRGELVRRGLLEPPVRVAEEGVRGAHCARSASAGRVHERSDRVPQAAQHPLAQPHGAHDHDMSDLLGTRPRLRAQQPAHHVHMGHEPRALQELRGHRSRRAGALHQRRVVAD